MADGLERFVAAQEAGGTYLSALAELRRGRKAGHWMWFVLPQIVGLGRSPTAVHFAVADLAEARKYLRHPLLGARLVECARVLADLPGTDAVAVLGPVDAQKLHSSMTLFATAEPEQPVFAAVLDKYYGGEADEGTTSRI